MKLVLRDCLAQHLTVCTFKPVLLNSAIANYCEVSNERVQKSAACMRVGCLSGADHRPRAYSGVSARVLVSGVQV